MTRKCTCAIAAAASLGAAVFGSTVLAGSLLLLEIRPSVAQTADQHNAPGGPRDRVNTMVRQQGFTLPPPPPTPPSAPVSTTTVRSPPSAPPAKKN